ncbi:MAG: D-aminoacyl-tRNA deacylase [Bacteroidota bacterium]
MRALIQRVSKASVEIDSKIVAKIGLGILVLLGVEESDNHDDVVWLCGKIVRLRIFPDPEDVMNLSVIEAGGDILLVSQFTLHASTKKGNRPSYIRAARPEQAIPLYEAFKTCLTEEMKKEIQSGEFGARMEVSLVNSGPVSIWIDTKNRE